MAGLEGCVSEGDVSLGKGEVWVSVAREEVFVRGLEVSLAGRGWSMDGLEVCVGGGELSVGEGEVWVSIEGREVSVGGGEVSLGGGERGSSFTDSSGVISVWFSSFGVMWSTGGGAG